MGKPFFRSRARRVQGPEKTLVHQRHTKKGTKKGKTKKNKKQEKSSMSHSGGTETGKGPTLRVDGEGKDSNRMRADTGMAHLEGLRHRHLEKSTSMKKNAALIPSDQVRRKESKSHTKWKAMVTDTLEDQQQKSPISQKEKVLVNDINSGRSFHAR